MGSKAQGACANTLFGIGQASAHPLPGTLTDGDLSLHRGGGDAGQQGLLLPQWVNVDLFQHAAPLQQAYDLLGGGFDDARCAVWRILP
ncbi:MAG TPA: hypothetical protein EYQ31_16160 [Candidatus Handelsmanbacteria bacterium]|nr:hypothetical protein [Candidatus Handelsmanbacteria bacterium]